jgi:hypothetical protein
MSKIKYTSEYEVLTPDGYKPFNGIRKLRKEVHSVVSGDYKLDCTIDHPFVVNGKIIKYRDLKIGDQIETRFGLVTITDLKSTMIVDDVYDLINVDDGNVYYTNDVLSHNCHFIETGESAISGNILERWKKSRKPPIATLDDGHYLIWEPPKEGNIYSIGVDVSEGVGEAASCAQVLDLTDLTNIRQVACYHDRMIDPHFFAEKLHKMANQWGRPYLAIERNNAGGQVIDGMFHTFGYNKFINISTTNGNKDRLGVYSHTGTKYKGVSNMRYWVNTLDVLSINDMGLIKELETFIRRPNGIWKKKDGRNIYDDRVDAFFWALIALETEVCQDYFEVVSYDERGKPSKIKNIHIEAPEFYKLDDVYQFNPGAPMPLLFGSNPDDPNNPTVGDLLDSGWNFVGN